MLEIGTIVGGGYRVTSVLGSGGMGTVYAAQSASGDAVAIKTLNPEFSAAPEVRSRFEREAHASGFLQHPHIVAVGEMGAADDGTLYLVMELVPGRSVAELLESGPLHPRRALVILRQTLLGLSYAHQHGLVHRDLKPENIMVARFGEPGHQYDHVKLLDFGIVKILADVALAFGTERLTRTGAVFGTPLYMAPEQALGRQVDGRTDLYAAGVALFEMLMGQPPFHHDDDLQLLRMHVSRPAPPLADAPWSTPEVRQLAGRAMAKDPAQRYQSAREMSSAVDAAFRSIDHIAND